MADLPLFDVTKLGMCKIVGQGGGHSTGYYCAKANYFLFFYGGRAARARVSVNFRKFLHAWRARGAYARV
jgi:hypothetical protein